MEKVGLNITPKEFKQLSKWAEEVYNLALVVIHLHREADLLNAFFIDHEKDIEV